MIHFDRVMAAIGVLVTLAGLVVGAGLVLGQSPSWPCTYQTYSQFAKETREAVCYWPGTKPLDF